MNRLTCLLIVLCLLLAACGSKPVEETTAPSTTAVRKVKDKKYLVQSFYLGGKDINTVIQRVAMDKAYAETLENKEEL